MKKETLPKITCETITKKVIGDYDTDLSCIGEYTDDLEAGVVVRDFDKYFDDLTEEELDNLPSRGREFRAFRPYAGGEKIGSTEYKKYGLQAYEHMQRIENGSISFVGVKVEAVLHFHYKDFVHTQTISSAGLWGIETDGKKDAEEYINSTAVDEYTSLIPELKAMGIKKIPALSLDD